VENKNRQFKGDIKIFIWIKQDKFNTKCLPELILISTYRLSVVCFIVIFSVICLCTLFFFFFLFLISGANVECVSRHPATVLKPIPCVVSNLIHQPELLLQDSGNFCWICSADHDIVELYIYLPQPRYFISHSVCKGNLIVILRCVVILWMSA
jgi:hypothetical protein